MVKESGLILQWHQVLLIEAVQIVLSVHITAVRKGLFRETGQGLRESFQVYHVLVLFKIVLSRLLDFLLATSFFAFTDLLGSFEEACILWR